MAIEDKVICLCLNKYWEAVGVKSIRDAITELTNPHCFALDLEYKRNNDGSYNPFEVERIEPVNWEKWINLPVRDSDYCISSPRIKVRAPTVLICSKYTETPKFHYRPTHRNIWFRDKGICQYTGTPLTKETGTIDHVIPKKLGGKNSWTNLVACLKEVNSFKGSRTPEEAGLKLIREPKELGPLSFLDTLSSNKHSDWNFVLKK